MPFIIYVIIDSIFTLTPLLLVLLASPESVGRRLIDPGPVCVGHTALLTCNVTGGIAINWYYTTNTGFTYTVFTSSYDPPTYTETVGGVLFTVTLLMPTSPHLVSQLSFNASAEMNGETFLCQFGYPSSYVSEDRITLQVGTIGK